MNFNFKEDAKKLMETYTNKNKKKKPDNLKHRKQQTQRLKRASQLLDLDIEESRKLSITIKNKKKIKNETHKMQEMQERQREEIKNPIIEKITKNYNDKKTNQELTRNTDFNLENITNYFKSKGVVGEEKLCLKIFLAASNNISFGVEGYSGSGKTFVVDNLIDLYDEKYLYRLDLSSKMAVFYDSRNINNYKTIYIPELQKALQETKSPIVEVVKNLTEGKDVKRIVTDYKKKGNKTFNIKKGKSIIYTLASENHYKNDEELNRRFLRFKTNHTESHLENILKQKSLRRQSLIRGNDEELKNEVIQEFNYLINTNISTYDPYSAEIIEYLPKTQKSIGYTEHYFSLVDAATKLNNNNRLQINHQGQEYTITSIEDHYLIHKLYHPEFLETLKEFSERNNNDEEVDEIIRLENKKINWNDIINEGTKILKKEAGIDLKEIKEEYITELEKKYDYLTAT